MLLGGIVVVVLGVMVVNYFKSIDDGSLVPGATTENGQAKVTRGEGSVTYIVGGGETLWGIAEKQYGSGYNWVDIAEANGLSNPELIAEGQELVVPDVEPRESTLPTEFIAVEDITANSIDGATYTVSEGDNLWEIAVRAYSDGYMWVEIARENDLANPGLIHTGNVLSLPR